jgi:hypothetical protein
MELFSLVVALQELGIHPAPALTVSNKALRLPVRPTLGAESEATGGRTDAFLLFGALSAKFG